MRLVLDHCVPRDLAQHIEGHEVSTALACGWSELRNGEFLKSAALAHFDAVLTVDASLLSQQNRAALPISVVVIRARSNRVEDLKPQVPAVLAALKALTPRTGVEVGAPPGRRST